MRHACAPAIVIASFNNERAAGFFVGLSNLGVEHMSYVESNLVPGETVIYQTRLHWIVMLGHLFVGLLLLGLPGALLLYYAFSEHGMDSNTLRLTEGGGVALLVGGAVVIL